MRKAIAIPPISIDTVQVRPLEAHPGSDFADAAAAHDLLRDAFRTLSPEHREGIALRFYADLTVEQIAERTGTRAGTVKSRLARARAAHRERLRDYGS